MAQEGLVYSMTPAGAASFLGVGEVGNLMPKHPEVIATGLTVARVMAARDNIIRSVLDDSLHTFQCV